LEDTGLETIARAQAGVEEQHKQCAPGQNIVMQASDGVVRLQLQAQLQHSLDLCLTEILQAQEMSAFQTFS
jgi:hypothetical protein